MNVLELTDIQGYIIRGYAHMQYSKFVLFRTTNAVAAKQWLYRITGDITNATHVVDKTTLPPTHLNIAFTAKGLVAFGLGEENVQTFNPEFREGMTTPHRRRILGDESSSAPELWNWGGPLNTELHGVLMIFGKDKSTCYDYYEKLKNEYAGFLEELLGMDGQTLPENKEHFGFRDGISQPIIKGSGKQGTAMNMINAGEFILGYKNEYNVYPDSPLLKQVLGDANLLPSDAAGSGLKDLGRNSSYLVIRQMQQDVEAFWTFMNEKTKNEDGSLNTAESTKLAAKMVGRWPSGAPVTKFPDADPGSVSDDNDFGYQEHDADGTKCPLGSHLRRCNPRDSFEDDGKNESVRLSNRHRIIRRARLYGDPFEGSPVNYTPGGEVGLLFNCFNADISRQFELIQYTWALSTKIKELYNDPDPLIGVKEELLPGQEQNFTLQGCPVNKTIKGLQPFVRIKGGAYFFFPSITFLRYLTTV
ncbi:MAG TPA: Dyp-type peroxidase [Phnomibacter sp.]|nr:Dyp-type peroxidase [Phnomibacter sp.]